MKMSTLLKKCKWSLQNKENLSKYQRTLLEAFLRQPTTNREVVSIVKVIADSNTFA